MQTGGSDSTVSPPGTSLLGLYVAIGTHTHLIGTSDSVADTGANATAVWQTITQDPPYCGVIWLQSDGTPRQLPAGAVAWWNTASPPTGFAQHTASTGRYLKGVASGADGGTTGGAASHAHTASTHTHTSTGHGHTSTTGASIGQESMTAGTAFDLAPNTHTHTVALGGAVAGSGGGTDATAASTAYDPPFTTLLAIRNAAAQFVPIGYLALWLGTLAGIPAGWQLADGTGVGGGAPTPPDTRGALVKAAVVTGDIGTTGGATGHTHSLDGSPGHTHPLAGHSHPVGTVSANGAGGANVVNAAPDNPVSLEAHGHTSPGGQSGTGGAGTTGSATQDLLSTADTRPLFRDVLYVQWYSDLAVALTSPTPAQVETTPGFGVAWTVTDSFGTQASFVVQLFGADQTTLVYTSGVVVSATPSFTVPAGHVHTGQTYYAAVSVTDTIGVSVDSALVVFSVAYTPLAAISGLTATPEPAATPPDVLLGWTAPTLVSGDAFVAYTVQRRPTGTTAWAVLGTIAAIGTHSFHDCSAASGTGYDYSVTYTTTRSLDNLTAPISNIATASVNFGGWWLVLSSDPTQWLKFPAASGTVQPVQENAIVATWGRRLPTVYLGQQDAHLITLVGAPDLFPVYAGALAVWPAVARFITAAASGGYLVVRSGQLREAYTCVIDASGSQRADALMTAVSTLKLIEISIEGA